MALKGKEGYVFMDNAREYKVSRRWEVVPMYMQSGMASETFILLQILMLGPDKRWLVRSII